MELNSDAKIGEGVVIINVILKYLAYTVAVNEQGAVTGKEEFVLKENMMQISYSNYICDIIKTINNL